LNRDKHSDDEFLVELITKNNIDVVILLHDDKKINLKSFKIVSSYSETILQKETIIIKKKIKFNTKESSGDDHEFTQIEISSFDIQNPKVFASVLHASVGDNSIPNERILIYSR
jgi:hypothetical protein